MKSTWSDEESKGSQEEDKLVSNQVTFPGSLFSTNCLFMKDCSEPVTTDTIFLSVKSNSVATECKASTSHSHESDLDSGEESEKDLESLQEAYENMYTQWLKVCASNRAINGEIQVLRDLNEKIKGKISQLEVMITEKEKSLKSVAIELERTKKRLRLLNNGSNKLDHLITTGKPFGDDSGIEYKGDSSSSRIVFVKSGLLDNSLNNAVKNPIVKSIATMQFVTTGKIVRNPMKNQKDKMFVPICNFCVVKGHIRPRCFTMMSFL